MKNNSHPVMDFSEKIRKIFLNQEFEEIINPSIINDEDVYKQYGIEAPLILDRSFYLAGLLRPDIGISKEKQDKIKKIAKINIKQLQNIFREYKEGKIEADDLIEEFVKQLKIKTEQAIEILALFPELKKLKPVPTKLILRSHMTGAWFLTIASLIEKRVLPLKLFSIGPRFRREQKQDSLHLYESLAASLVIVDKKIDFETGKKLTKKIFSELGFEKIVFKIKKATANYYEQGKEFEVFGKLDGKEVELGDGGLYSSRSLANYGIDSNVFNVGFGIERIAMLMKNISDIRVLVYPQFYTSSSFTDKQIADSIAIKKQPKTKQGKEIAKKIEKGILKYKDEIGVKKFLVHQNKDMKIFVSEPETGKKLLGPAGLNSVYIYDGNILGINEKNTRSPSFAPSSASAEATADKPAGATEGYCLSQEAIKGVKTYTYIEAISNLFATYAEEKKLGIHTIKMADTLPSINLEIKKTIENFITSQNKKIDVRGPIFIDIEIQKN